MVAARGAGISAESVLAAAEAALRPDHATVGSKEDQRMVRSRVRVSCRRDSLLSRKLLHFMRHTAAMAFRALKSIFQDRRA